VFVAGEKEFEWAVGSYRVEGYTKLTGLDPVVQYKSWKGVTFKEWKEAVQGAIEMGSHPRLKREKGIRPLTSWMVSRCRLVAKTYDRHEQTVTNRKIDLPPRGRHA
jgi:hypothetical protein